MSNIFHVCYGWNLPSPSIRSSIAVTSACATRSASIILVYLIRASFEFDFAASNLARACRKRPSMIKRERMSVTVARYTQRGEKRLNTYALPPLPARSMRDLHVWGSMLELLNRVEYETVHLGQNWEDVLE